MHVVRGCTPQTALAFINMAIILGMCLFAGRIAYLADKHNIAPTTRPTETKKAIVAERRIEAVSTVDSVWSACVDARQQS